MSLSRPHVQCIQGGPVCIVLCWRRAAGSLRHQLVHYADTFSKGQSPKRMSSTPDGRVVFVPRGSDVQASGVLVFLGGGHWLGATHTSGCGGGSTCPARLPDADDNGRA
jgi:hypothetical protein